MYVLDILAFWKRTVDSFQHKFFVTLWSFHQKRRRNKSSSASLYVSGELESRLNQIARTDNNRDERGVRSRNRDNFISLQYETRKGNILLLSDF